MTWASLFGSDETPTSSAEENLVCVSHQEPGWIMLFKNHNSRLLQTSKAWINPFIVSAALSHRWNHSLSAAWRSHILCLRGKLFPPLSCSHLQLWFYIFSVQRRWAYFPVVVPGDFSSAEIAAFTVCLKNRWLESVVLLLLLQRLDRRKLQSGVGDTVYVHRNMLQVSYVTLAHTTRSRLYVALSLHRTWDTL